MLFSVSSPQSESVKRHLKERGLTRRSTISSNLKERGKLTDNKSPQGLTKAKQPPTAPNGYLIRLDILH